MYCDNVTASFRGTGIRLNSEGELTSDTAELRMTEVFRSTWDGYKAVGAIGLFLSISSLAGASCRAPGSQSSLNAN